MEYRKRKMGRNGARWNREKEEVRGNGMCWSKGKWEEVQVLELRKWKRREENEYWKVEDRKLSQIKSRNLLL